MSETSPIERYLLLDDVIGWRAEVPLGLTRIQCERHLELQPLPGPAEPLLAEHLKQEFTCPAALALDRCDGALVLDAARHIVKRIQLNWLSEKEDSLAISRRCP